MHAVRVPHRFAPNLHFGAQPSWLLIALTVLATTASAIDLSRLTPVPPDQTIPVEDFFRPSRIADPRINDAGTRVAAIVSGEEDKTMLMVLEVEGWETEFLHGINEKDVYRYAWLTDDRILFNLSYQKRFADSMLVARLGKRIHTYYLFRYGKTRIVGVPQDRPLRPVVWVEGGTSGKEQLGAVELNAKLEIESRRPLQRGLSDWDFAKYVNEQHIVKRYPETGDEWGQTVGYQADRTGHLAYAYTIRDGVPHLHVLNEDAWQISPIDLDTYDILRVADTPGHVLVAELLVSGEPAKVLEMNAASGEAGEIIFQDDAYSFSGELYRDRQSDRIVGAIYDRAEPVSVWFDPTYQKLQTALNSFFPGKVVRIHDSNKMANRFIVRVYSDQDPISYHLVDLKDRKVTLIESSRPWLDPTRMNRMSIIQFKTAEGVELDAYVTLPAGASKTNPPPLIVLPHGSPWVRDSWGFNAEVQFLANRGYAVLQPNYRGSTGSGWKFTRDDQWDFAKMHDDVTRATKALVGSGYVDPQRVAIMGSSFGGYLALMGVVEEPDLYQCAVSFAGVFDWEEAVKTAALSKYEEVDYQIFLRHLGDPEDEVEKYECISPGRRVENIRGPVFIAHGKEDKTVSVTQSRRLIRDLKAHGIEHESLLLSREGHGTAYIENSVELYTRIEAFLAKHL